MVLDKRRNEAYARAIRALVRPDSIVMDLGAGLGIHGLIAAAAGARMVYLVEPEPVVLAALEAARANGLADRITIVRERIEDADIPEKVDLIVSALTGNLLFSEDLLPSLYHARDRHLQPQGKLVPDRAELWLSPCMSEALREQYVAAWQQPLVGLDYAFAARCAANDLAWPTPPEIAATKLLSPGGRLASVDLAAESVIHCDGRVEMAVEYSGVCHGLIGWIRIKVGDEWLSSAPGAPALHWSPAYLPIDPPIALRSGETIGVTLHRPPLGEWTWTLRAESGKRRHSTFLAQAGSVADLATLGAQSRPGLGDRGARLRDALHLLSEGRSIAQIASHLEQQHAIPPGQALLEAQVAAQRYGKTR
jgi:SAM-dependent methyltransferase